MQSNFLRNLTQKLNELLRVMERHIILSMPHATKIEIGEALFQSGGLG